MRNFPSYSENLGENMADFCHDTSKFIEYPNFLEYFTTINIGNAIFVWIVPIIQNLPTNL